MKCYIYFIINKVTNQRYVGQTTNFSRRKSEHLLKLKENRHPNPKLQAAYNKYGEDNFVIQKFTFEDITKEELNQLEIEYIEKFDSYKNGYNLTIGGTGGDTRSKLTFEQFCFAYFGNKEYEGMTSRTGKYLGVDSSCISAIIREKSYDGFRQKALTLSNLEQEEYIRQFEKELNIQEQKPWTKQKTLDEDTTLKIMCVTSTYGRGIEKAILEYFSLSKGFIFHLMTGNGRTAVKNRYAALSKEERQEMGKKYFKEWNLQTYAKVTLKEKYTDLMIKYSS